MHKFRKFLILFIASAVIFSLQREVTASDINLPKVSINPNSHLLYSFKRLFEKSFLFTKFTNQSKADYYRDLTLTRMSELKNVVDGNLLGEVEQSAQRFSYQVGVLSDFLAANGTSVVDKKSKNIEILNELKDPLIKLRDKHKYDSSYWMLIQHSIDSIDLNLQKLK